MPITDTRHSLVRFLLLTALATFSWIPSLEGSEPAGRWRGRWVSGTNGHSGPMRARITPTENGSYNAVFAGRFALVIPFVYRAELQPVDSWQGTSYVVEKSLGFLGTYRMQANVDHGQMNANWSAVGDAGQVKMQRVGY